MVNAKNGKLVIGTRDLKRLLELWRDWQDHPRFNHRLELEFGCIRR